MEDWPVFLCYRQVDGRPTAEWLHKQLHQLRFPMEVNQDARLDIYFDQTAPAVGNWRDVHQPSLERARAMLVVCTPGLHSRFQGDDWVHRELDWWLDRRRMAPILIDTTGDGNRWIPESIQRRYPNAQRIELKLAEWEELGSEERSHAAQRIVSRIIEGIRRCEAPTTYEAVMPDEISLPTADELGKLPHWAAVAFAARCARRVQPLFTADWPDAPREHWQAIDHAIGLAESCAAMPGGSAISAAVAGGAYAAYCDAKDAAEAAETAGAVRAVGIAQGAYAVADATRADAGDATAARGVAFAVVKAADAASVVGAVRAAFLDDFARLRVAAEKENWTTDTPVRPEFFGPMWPNGEPEGWPKTADRKLRILVDADVDRDVFAEFLAEFASFYSELSSGDELIIRDGHVFTFEREPVPS